jgi:rhodanese-related sulfurtransferase/predicted transcriptional regulator
MADHAAKTALFEALAEAAKALSSGRRAELVDVLDQGERSVEELADQIQQSVANTSQHLQRLLRAGLVQSRREGTRVYYSLAGPSVSQLWRTLRAVAEQHVDGLADLAERYVGDRTGLEVMTRDELRRRLRARDVVVLDVRPEPEYTAGHIAGAVSVPFDTLRARLGEIPTGTQVVAYCRGPYCVYADDAVRLLRRRGRSAARLEDGYPEWQAAGLPTR